MKTAEAALGKPLKQVIAKVLEASSSHREACKRFNDILRSAGAKEVTLPTFIRWCLILGLRAERRMVVTT